MTELKPGDRAGIYYIQRKLKDGQGGMSTVYEATVRPEYGQAGWPKRFALKVAGLEYEDFLKRECDFLARLDHVNVVKVYPVQPNPRRNVYLAREEFRTGWSPYFVMEYLNGGSLEELIRQKGKLNIRRAVDITRQFASALSHIHSWGMIHLDIKPENILFRRQRAFLRPTRLQPVLCDFGLARGLGYPPPVKSGTPDYMSPEQFQEVPQSAQPIDYRSDIFSLGVVLYKMLTGQLPFEEPGQLLHPDAPTSPLFFNSHLSPQLEAITMRCLAKNLVQRYQNTLELERDLEVAE